MGSITDRILERVLGMRPWAVAPLTAAIAAVRAISACLDEWFKTGDASHQTAARQSIIAAQASVSETGGAGQLAVARLAHHVTQALDEPPAQVDLPGLQAECSTAVTVLARELRAARWPSIWRLAIGFIVALALARVVTAAAGVQLRCAIPLVCDQLAAELVLEDVRVSDAGEGEDEGVAIIDIIVRNNGDRAAVVHEVEFTITGYQFIIASGAIPSSATYTGRFPITGDLPGMFDGGTPRLWSVDVAQLVDPIGGADVDRFTLRIVPEAGGAAGLHDYRFRIRLVYDADRSIEDPEEYLVRLPYRVD